MSSANGDGVARWHHARARGRDRSGPIVRLQPATDPGDDLPMSSVPHSSVLRALTASAVLSLGFAAPALAGTGTLSVHGVTAVVTDVASCNTRVEVGFSVDITDLPLSGGHIDHTSVTATTVTVDGAPAAGYSTRTDFGVAPFYFALLELQSAAPGPHVLSIAGGQAGVSWRAFDHSNPTTDYVAFLNGDYALSFVVPPCGADAPAVFSRFAPPVDDAPTLNLVRRGLTVPIRFQVSRADSLLTDPAEFSVSVSQCRRDPSDPIDLVERTAPPARAGELFYDPAAEMFVYRWTAPRGKHPCWHVTFTHNSGASVTARFRTFASS